MPRDEAPISLETRMAFVLVAYFGGLWLLAALVGSILGVGSLPVYFLWALVFLMLQNLAAPSLYEGRLRIAWPSVDAEPRLANAVENAALAAEIPTPRIGVSSLRMFNAFAYGRTRSDSRVCLTRPLLDVLTDEELDAVIKHEVCHIKSFDVTVLSLLAVIPVMSQAVLDAPGVISGWVGPLAARILFRLLALLVSPVVWLVWLLMLPANLVSVILINYASRVRELSADQESVRLGVQPDHLASALFKIATAPADTDDVRRIAGSRALLLEPKAGAYEEIVFLKRFDADGSGAISPDELAALRAGRLSVSFPERIKEVFSTHPLVQKRFRRLAELS